MTSFGAAAFICIGWKLSVISAILCYNSVLYYAYITAYLLPHDVISSEQYRDIGKQTENRNRPLIPRQRRTNAENKRLQRGDEINLC